MNATNRHLSERELVEGARRGNVDAIGAIYAAHGAPLFRLAARLAPSDAEDVVHDVFVGLPELLGRYEHRDTLSAWLRAVVVRTALMRLRRASRRGDVALTTATDAPVPASDVWTAIDLERALATLDADHRAVVVLKQLEGYSHAEIARLIDITEGASRARFTRALRRLRTLLEPNR